MYNGFSIERIGADRVKVTFDGSDHIALGAMMFTDTYLVSQGYKLDAESSETLENEHTARYYNLQKVNG